MSNIHFPGNSLLINTPGVTLRVTEKALKTINSELHTQLEHLRRGPAAAERAITHAYSRDPVVMELLEMYLKRVPDITETPGSEDTHTEWPA